MRLVILHLSDLHFQEHGNSVADRGRLIAEALRSVEPLADGCVIVVAGDISISGKSSEYDAALKFLEAISKLQGSY